MHPRWSVEELLNHPSCCHSLPVQHRVLTVSKHIQSLLKGQSWSIRNITHASQGSVQFNHSQICKPLHPFKDRPHPSLPEAAPPSLLPFLRWHMDYGELLQGRDSLSNDLSRLRGLEQYCRGATPSILVLQQQPVNRPVDLKVQSLEYKVQSAKYSLPFYR